MLNLRTGVRVFNCGLSPHTQDFSLSHITPSQPLTIPPSSHKHVICPMLCSVFRRMKTWRTPCTGSPCKMAHTHPCGMRICFQTPYAQTRRTIQEVSMKLDDRIKELIAVGASIAANCQPCLEYHVGEARKTGVDAQEITDAIEVGKMVRRGASSKMDKFATTLSLSDAPATASSGEACGCPS